MHDRLGANLARLELRVLFEELLTFGLPPSRLVAPVEWTRSNRHTGIWDLVVELRDIRPDVRGGDATGICRSRRRSRFSRCQRRAPGRGGGRVCGTDRDGGPAWRVFDFRDLDVPIGLFTNWPACGAGRALAEHRIVLWALAAMALQGRPSFPRWRPADAAARCVVTWSRARRVGTGQRRDIRIGHRVSRLGIVFLAVVFWVLAMCVYLLMTGLIVGRVDRPSPTVGS